MIDLQSLLDIISNIKNTTFILHKNLQVNTAFKCYKNFCYNVYEIINSNKKLLFSHTEIKQVKNTDIKAVWEECDKIFSKLILEYFIKNA